MKMADNKTANKLKENFDLSEVTGKLHSVLDTLSMLDGKHNMLVTGDKMKDTIDQLATSRLVVDEALTTIKEQILKIFSYVERPLNKKTAEPVKSVHLVGNVYDILAKYSNEGSLTDLPEGVTNTEALFEILKKAVEKDCVEKLFNQPSIKATDVSEFDKEVVGLLAKYGYIVREKEKPTVSSPDLVKGGNKLATQFTGRVDAIRESGESSDDRQEMVAGA